MQDRATKVLLGVIALGIWAHVIVFAVATGSVPLLQPQTLMQRLAVINSNLNDIAYGSCQNSKICR